MDFPEISAGAPLIEIVLPIFDWKFWSQSFECGIVLGHLLTSRTRKFLPLPPKNGPFFWGVGIFSKSIVGCKTYR